MLSSILIKGSGRYGGECLLRLGPEHERRIVSGNGLLLVDDPAASGSLQTVPVETLGADTLDVDSPHRIDEPDPVPDIDAGKPATGLHVGSYLSLPDVPRVYARDATMTGTTVLYANRPVGRAPRGSRVVALPVGDQTLVAVNGIAGFWLDGHGHRLDAPAPDFLAAYLPLTALEACAAVGLLVLLGAGASAARLHGRRRRLGRDPMTGTLRISGDVQHVEVHEHRYALHAALELVESHEPLTDGTPLMLAARVDDTPESYRDAYAGILVPTGRVLWAERASTVAAWSARQRRAARLGLAGATLCIMASIWAVLAQR